MSIKSSLAKFQPLSSLSKDEINDMRRKCYEMGLVVIELDRIDNDFVKQGLINIMNKIYPNVVARA